MVAAQSGSMAIMLYILRHGETEWNRSGRFQGQNNSPLTDRGKAQARAMGRLLRDRLEDTEHAPISASPLGRTQQALEIVCEELGRQPATARNDKALMKICYGDWEGKTATEVALHDRAAHELRYQDRLRNRVPNGESYLDIYHRAAAWLAGIELERETVVVAHGAFNRMLIAAACGHDPELHLDTQTPQDAIYAATNGSYQLVNTDYRDEEIT
mgnify:FL=1